MNFGFVILHYMDKKSTIACVERILNLNNSNVEVVIIDNNSFNGSGPEIKKFFEKNKNVNTILNTENMGFARGNNVGFRFLRENFDLDFMVILNNDILIKDGKFLNKITSEYSISKFDVLGPDIISLKSNSHQNPAHNTPLTMDQVVKMKKDYIQVLNNFTFYYIKHKLASYLKNFFNLGKSNNNIEKKVFNEKRTYNSVLYGACYILSKNIIDKKENFFYPKTFMYFEEEFLHYQCLKDGYKMVYTPSISVFHLEDVATNSSFSNDYTREKIKCTRMLDSIKKYIDYVKIVEG